LGSRPSIGALRRRQQAEAAGRDDTAASSASPPPPTAAPAEAEPAAQRDVSTSDAPAPTVDRDTLTEAWGDGILQSLPARAKARFASGRFVAVDEQGAHFALPHAAHRDQCAEQLPIVETALERHFGTKVRLVLVVDDEAAPPPPRGTAARRPASPAADTDVPDEADDDLHDVDPSDLVDEAAGGEDEASAASARLLQAFPGASEVVG
jgi:hypothetical protein